MVTQPKLPASPQEPRVSNTLKFNEWRKVIPLACFGLGTLLFIVGAAFHTHSVILIGGVLWLVAMAFGLLDPRLANYRFTLWILMANLAALLQPAYFKSIAGFSMTDPWLLLILVQLIMFGMGTQMSVRDFYHILKMPAAVAISVTCQFLIMPMLGFLLALTFPLPPEVAAGLILIGSCSSGLSSNVMTFMARGNLALSVTLTALTTLIAPIVTPLWMRLLAGSFVEIDAVKMSLDIFKMVLVPILAAFVHDFMSSKDRRVRIATLTCFGLGLAWLLWLSIGNGWPWLLSKYAPSGDTRIIGWLSIPGFVAAACVFGSIYHWLARVYPTFESWMPRVSMFGIIYYTLVATAEGRDQLLAVGFVLFVAVLIHNLCGFLLGYWSSRLLGLCPNDARTVAIEVGLQNGAMATGLARSMDKLGTTGLAALIFAPLMNVTGSILANYWRQRPTQESDTTEAVRQ